MTTTTPDQTVVNINDNAQETNTVASNNEATSSSPSPPTSTVSSDTKLNLEPTSVATNVDNTSSNLSSTPTNMSTIPTITDTPSNFQPISINIPSIDNTLTSPATPTNTPSFDKPITGPLPTTNISVNDKPITGPSSTINTSVNDKTITGASVLTSTPSDEKPITFQATPLKTVFNEPSNIATPSSATVTIEDPTTAKPSEDERLLEELNKIEGVVKDKATRDGVFAAAVGAAVCGSAVLFCCLGLAAIVPLLKLIVGWHYADQCPISWRIPHYLVIAGVVGLSTIALSLVQALFGIIDFLKNASNSKVLKTILRVMSILQTAAGVFLIIWFILGCIWVFRVWNKVQYKYPDRPNYCHGTLYRFAYWLLFIALFGYACTFCNSFRQLRAAKANKRKGQAKPVVTTQP